MQNKVKTLHVNSKILTDINDKLEVTVKFHRSMRHLQNTQCKIWGRRRRKEKKKKKPNPIFQ
jgi:hypothetical protein